MIKIPIKEYSVSDICNVLGILPVSLITTDDLFLSSNVIAQNLDAAYCPGSTPANRLANLRTKPYHIGKWRNYTDYVRMVVGYAYPKEAIKNSVSSNYELAPPPGWKIPTSTDYYNLFNSMTLSGNFMFGNNHIGNFIKSEVVYSETYKFGWENASSDIFGFKLNRVPAVMKSRDPGGQTGLAYHSTWGSLGCIDGGGVKYITVEDGNDIIELFDLVSTVPIGYTRPIGVPLRFMKEDSINPGYVVDYNGNIYPTVDIKGYIITSENIRSTRTKGGGELVLGDAWPSPPSWLGSDSNIVGYSNVASVISEFL